MDALRAGDWRHVVFNALTELADPASAPALLDVLDEPSEHYIPNFIHALCAVKLPASTLAQAMVRILDGHATPQPSCVLALQILASSDVEDATLSDTVAACRRTWLKDLEREHVQHFNMRARRSAQMVDTATATLLARDGWQALPIHDVSATLKRQVKTLSVLHDVDARLVGHVLSSHVNTALQVLTALAKAFQDAPFDVLTTLPWLDAGHAVAAPTKLGDDDLSTNATLRGCAHALAQVLVAMHGERWRGLEADQERALRLARAGDVVAAQALSASAARHRRPALDVMARLSMIVANH